MVPFVSQKLNNLELALALAKRGNLPGAEALVGQNFDRLFASGQFKDAAEAAAESPQVLQHSPPHKALRLLYEALLVHLLVSCTGVSINNMVLSSSSSASSC